MSVQKFTTGARVGRKNSEFSNSKLFIHEVTTGARVGRKTSEFSNSIGLLFMLKLPQNSKLFIEEFTIGANGAAHRGPLSLVTDIRPARAPGVAF